MLHSTIAGQCDVYGITVLVGRLYTVYKNVLTPVNLINQVIIREHSMEMTHYQYETV